MLWIWICLIFNYRIPFFCITICIGFEAMSCVYTAWYVCSGVVRTVTDGGWSAGGIWIRLIFWISRSLADPTSSTCSRMRIIRRYFWHFRKRRQFNVFMNTTLQAVEIGTMASGRNCEGCVLPRLWLKPVPKSRYTCIRGIGISDAHWNVSKRSICRHRLSADSNHANWKFVSRWG